MSVEERRTQEISRLLESPGVRSVEVLDSWKATVTADGALVYVYVAWSGLSRQGLSVLAHRLAEVCLEPVDLLIVDYDADPEFPLELNVRGIGEFFLLGDGKIVDRITRLEHFSADAIRRLVVRLQALNST